MPIDLPIRRRTRLPRVVYADVTAVCAITIAVKDRRPVFVNERAATAAVVVLRQLATRTQVAVHAFCVMPDHVHLVLSPSPDLDLITFIGQWKNLVQRELWRLGIGGACWQSGFWDRFLRRPEAIAEAIRYVHDNPVRAGLAAEARLFAFSSAADAAGRP